MISFEKDELLKTAKLSGFTLDDDEIEVFKKHLEKVINYTSEINSVKIEDVHTAKIKSNVRRDDKVIPCDSEKILEQAPDKSDSYFVVPKIL